MTKNYKTEDHSDDFKEMDSILGLDESGKIKSELKNLMLIKSSITKSLSTNVLVPSSKINLINQLLKKAYHKCSVLEKESERLSMCLENKNKKLEDLKEAMAGLKLTIDKKDALRSECINKLKEVSDNNKIAIDNLKKKNSEQLIKNESLSKELFDKKDKFSRLKSAFDNKVEEIKRLSEENKFLKKSNGRLSSLGKESERLSMRLENKNKKLEDLKKAMAGLKLTIDKKDALRSECVNKLKEVSDNNKIAIDNLKKKNSEQLIKNEFLSKELFDRKDKFVRLKSAFDNKVEKIKSLSEENKFLKKSNDRLSSILEEKDATLRKTYIQIRDEHILSNMKTTESSHTPSFIPIASGGSSGSHLLGTILANFKPFFTGPEANIASNSRLFNNEEIKPVILEGFMKKMRLTKPEVLSNGVEFHLMSTLLLSNENDYLINSSAVKLDLLQKANSWSGLVNYIITEMRSVGAIQSGEVWVEHSPSNSVSIDKILEDKDIKGIHLLRDPRDAVASMMQRRWSLTRFSDLSARENMLISAKQWCVLNKLAMSTKSNLYRLTYENLVTDTEREIENILLFLGSSKNNIRPEPKMLGNIAVQKGWKNSPLDFPSTTSIGRHREVLSKDMLKELEEQAFVVEELGVETRFSEFEKFYWS